MVESTHILKFPLESKHLSCSRRELTGFSLLTDWQSRSSVEMLLKFAVLSAYKIYIP
jgi:hypothetical protein